MSRWYWGAVACGVAFLLCWFLLPPFERKDGLGAVYRSQIGLSWNWTDPNGNPLHDAQGNAIQPFWPRTLALVVFALGAIGLFTAGFIAARRRRPPAGTEPGV